MYVVVYEISNALLDVRVEAITFFFFLPRRAAPWFYIFIRLICRNRESRCKVESLTRPDRLYLLQ